MKKKRTENESADSSQKRVEQREEEARSSGLAIIPKIILEIDRPLGQQTRPIVGLHSIFVSSFLRLSHKTKNDHDMTCRCTFDDKLLLLRKILKT